MANPKRVVLLDDEEALRSVLSDELRGEGYDVIAFASKVEGYDWIAENIPDLILSDIKSPVMNGFQFLEWVRANPRTAHIPFIFQTGYADLEIAIRTKRMGADDIVSKPYDFEDLLQTVVRVLREPRVHKPCLQEAEEMQFLPWPALEKRVRELPQRIHARVGPLDHVREWCMDFVLETGNRLFGVRFSRPFNLHASATEQILEFRQMLDSRGLESGLLYTVSMGKKPLYELDTLLGIQVRNLSENKESSRITAELVKQNSWTKEQRELVLRFREFSGRVFREISQLNGKTFGVPLSIGALSPVKFEQVSAWGVSFRVYSDRSSLLLPIEEAWHMIAVLWSKEHVKIPSCGEASKEEVCFGHLLSVLPSVDSNGVSLSLRDRIHLTRERPFIVVLDDDDTFRGLLSSILNEEGIDVRGFCYKDEFLRQLPFLRPDLVITDIAAPRMSGLEFLEKIKSDKKFCSIPVIVLSGNIPKLATEAMQRGASECLSKPPGFPALHELIRSHLPRKGNASKRST